LTLPIESSSEVGCRVGWLMYALAELYTQRDQVLTGQRPYRSWAYAEVCFNQLIFVCASLTIVRGLSGIVTVIWSALWTTHKVGKGVELTVQGREASHATDFGSVQCQVVARNHNYLVHQTKRG